MITPNNYIVGNLRGKELKLCSGNTEHPKSCFPNDVHDLLKGDIVDFSWGMTNGQVGDLVYAIVENNYHDELR